MQKKYNILNQMIKKKIIPSKFLDVMHSIMKIIIKHDFLLMDLKFLIIPPYNGFKRLVNHQSKKD